MRGVECVRCELRRVQTWLALLLLLKVNVRSQVTASEGEGVATSSEPTTRRQFRSTRSTAVVIRFALTWRRGSTQPRMIITRATPRIEDQSCSLPSSNEKTPQRHIDITANPVCIRGDHKSLSTSDRPERASSPQLPHPASRAQLGEFGRRTIRSTLPTARQREREREKQRAKEKKTHSLGQCRRPHRRQSRPGHPQRPSRHLLPRVPD